MYTVVHQTNHSENGTYNQLVGMFLCMFIIFLTIYFGLQIISSSGAEPNATTPGINAFLEPDPVQISDIQH